MTTTLLLALVPIVSESDIGLREVYESASAALELRPSLELLSDESLFVLGGPQQPVLECGSDLACLSRHLERLEADLGLVIVVSRAGPQHLIDLRLIRTEVASLIITRRHAHSPAEGPMTEALASRIAQLFDAAGFHRVSRLTVTVSPDTARVWLDGTPLDLRDAIIPPGTHVIRAAAEGYLESERSVEVAPGRDLSFAGGRAEPAHELVAVDRGRRGSGRRRDDGDRPRDAPFLRRGPADVLLRDAAWCGRVRSDVTERHRC